MNIKPLTTIARPFAKGGQSPETCTMKPMSRSVIAAFTTALCLTGAALADDDDYPSWRPNNDSATTITGPVILLPNRLHAGNANFPLRMDSKVDAFKPGQGSIPARIYAVTTPTNPVLLNGNK